MTEEAKPEIRKLEGEAALKLWRQGRDTWNSWIALHPRCRISFSGVDFSKEHNSGGTISFASYCFGDGDVTFAQANFGNGYVDFTEAIFGSGHTYFFEANFGDCHLDFSESIFGNGYVDFSYSTFGDGHLDFFRATFDASHLNFYGTTFGESIINFTHARVQDLKFSPKTIGSSRIEAEGLSTKGRVIFNIPSPSEDLKSFNLHGASFDGPLTLKGHLSLIPDLRATRYSHQVDLSDLNVKLRRTWPRPSWPIKFSLIAENSKDGPKLRRLKEIAETNKDHQAALRFSADENRAKRWIETSWIGSVLDMAFSAFSDYGQNILRPFVALIVLTTASMGLYKTLATETSAAGWEGWAQAALLSASNSLPFLPQSRDLREDALTALYGTTDPGLWVDALMITQGVLSFIFLFLIGLGLRNRFRL